MAILNLPHTFEAFCKLYKEDTCSLIIVSTQKQIFVTANTPLGVSVDPVISESKGLGKFYSKSTLVRVHCTY